MPQLIADRKEIDFILYELLDAEQMLEYEKFDGFSKKMFNMIISEARKLSNVFPFKTNGTTIEHI